MITKKNYLAALTAILIVIAGCESLFDKNMSDQPSSETFFSNERELEMAINGAYTVLYQWEARNNIPIGAELDNATDLGYLRSGHLKTISEGAHSSSQPLIENRWERLYNGIAKSNNILENMSRAEGEISERFYAEVRGQAKFLRAFSYHFLVEHFGDVPLITEVPVIEEADQVERTPKDEVVDQIMADLDAAAEDLPISWSGSDVGRATQGAAYALKARVALFNERYEQAIGAAQEVMNLGEYSLHPNYEELFQYDGQGSDEIIFELQFEHSEGRSHLIPFRFGTRLAGGVTTSKPSQFLVDSYIAADGLPIDESEVYDPANPFENRDPRLDATIVRPQTEFAGYVFETHPDSTFTFRIEGEDSTRVENTDVTNPFSTFTGYTWRKYVSAEDFPDNTREGSVNWIYLRYGEVLLTYAEAKIESGNIDQSAIDALNKVRARGFGVQPEETDAYPEITANNQSELRRILRNERKVELALEGLRWYDIRRWGIAQEVMEGPVIGRPSGDYSEIPEPPSFNVETGHPQYGNTETLYESFDPRGFTYPRDYLWPIPQNELDVMENLTQNPGY